MKVNATSSTETICLGGGVTGDQTLWIPGFSWSGICLDLVPFLLVDGLEWSNTSFVPDQFQLNGTFGLGRDSSSFLNIALAKGFISDKIFSFQPSADVSQSSILIGGVDLNQILGNIAWQASPVISAAPNSWFTQIQSLAVGQVVIFNKIQNIKAEFVYSYLNLGLNSTLWQETCKALQLAYAVNSELIVCNSTDSVLPYALGSCDYFTAIPNITLSFASQHYFTLTDRLVRFDDFYGTDPACYWRFEDIGDQSVLLVGQTFLAHFYVAFNVTSKQIGIALSTEILNATLESPWISITPPFDLPPSQTHPAIFNVSLTQVSSYISSITASFGTPPQNGTFLLANDLSVILTPSQICSTCGHALSFFDETLSVTYFEDETPKQKSVANILDMTYTLANETVCLGGGEQDEFSWTWGFSRTGICLTSTPVRFIEGITWTNQSYTPDQFLFNGTFGLGRSQTSESFLYQAKQQNFISQLAWAYEPNANYSQPGMIEIGAVSTNQTVSGIAWVPAPQSPSEPDAWITSLQELDVGYVIVLDTLQNLQVKFMTGYLNIGMNSSLWYQNCRSLQVAYAGFFPSAPLMACNSTQSQLPFVKGTCSQFSSSLNITFRFNSSTFFTSDIRNFMFDDQIDSNSACFWRFEDIGDQATLLIGQPFIQQFYTAFDVTNQKVGFGVSKANPSSHVEGPWISNSPAYEIPASPSLPATFNITTSNVASYIYVIEASFGYPPQNSTLLLVNDQSKILIPSSTCTNCSPSTNAYNLNASLTYQFLAQKEDSFGSFAANYSNSTETICLGGADPWGFSWQGFCLKDAPFMLVNNKTWTNSSFAPNEFQFNGMFGLGRQDNSDSFLVQALNQGLINSRVWAYSPNADYRLSGSVTIGGFNETENTISDKKGNQVFNWIQSPINQGKPNAWETAIKAVSVCQAVMFDELQSVPAQWVTGYQFIGLHQFIWKQACSALQAAWNTTGTPIMCVDSVSSLPYARAPCSDFPPGIYQFVLNFNTSEYYEMSISTLAFDGTYDNQAACYWAFENLGKQEAFIIGQPFLSQYYTVFDAENKQIGVGISNANPNQESEGPWIGSYDPTPWPVPLKTIMYIGLIPELGLIAFVVYTMMKSSRISRQARARREVAIQ